MKSTEYNDIERPEHTLDKISELKTNEVLVLGLSIEGMHGCWAAYTAFKKIRAALRCGVGLRCQSYAIPTMYGVSRTLGHTWMSSLDMQQRTENSSSMSHLLAATLPFSRTGRFLRCS